MAERWRKPVVPLAIETHDSEAILLPDGRTHRQAVLALRPDDIERMRAGYVCVKCLEPFEQAWPERCPICGAPVRKEQAAYFARELGPSMQIGSSVSLADELEALPERVAKEKEDHDGS